MKKKLFLIVAFFCCGYLNAQEDGKIITIRLGTNFPSTTYKDTELDINNNEYIHSTFRTHLGADIVIPFNDKFSFAGELLYNGRGSYTEQPNQWGTVSESKLKLNYFDLSAMGIYHVNINHDLFSPYAKLGPYLGYFFAGKQILNGTEYNLKDEAYRDALKSIDFGLNIAVGSYIDLDFGKFSAELRYSLGLLNIEGKDSDAGQVVKNRLFMLSFGYIIPL